MHSSYAIQNNKFKGPIFFTTTNWPILISANKSDDSCN